MPLTLFAFKSVDLHLVTAPHKALLSDRGNLLHSLLCFNSGEIDAFITLCQCLINAITKGHQSPCDEGWKEKCHQGRIT